MVVIYLAMILMYRISMHKHYDSLKKVFKIEY